MDHLDPAVPADGMVDLVGIPLDRLREIDETALALSIRHLLDRMRDGRLPLDSFDAGL